MRFSDEMDCKLSVSIGIVNVPKTSKMKTNFLLKLDFAAESARCRRMISRLQ